MFCATAKWPCPVILTDYRFSADKALDEAHGGTHVLHQWAIGRAAFGGLRYLNQTTRAALFDYRQDLSERVRNAARVELAEWLKKLPPSRIFVLPNATGTRDQLPATLCWQALSAPDGAAQMRGTCWTRNGHLITPLYPDAPLLKDVQKVQQAEWLRRWQEPVLTCKRKHAYLSQDAFAALVRMVSAKVVAVDIETMTTGNLITAIGVSDGHTAVSVPYDTYRPYQHTEDEPGWRMYGDLGVSCRTVVSEILSSSSIKVFHNYTFDKPRLEAEGFTIGGTVHDTFAAHAIAWPELQHGLQHACASLLNVPPWKSVYHPQLKGITRDDEEFWIADPVALRDYNCDDAFYTWHLAAHLLGSVEVK